MKVAKNASSKLKGMAKYKILNGKIPIFPKTTHIKTNPTNQVIKVVCIRLNFLEIMKIAMANRKDHSPQMAPLIGSDGNTMPILS
jgi:hypothetical protein